jgi:hypothetical protein
MRVLLAGPHLLCDLLNAALKDGGVEVVEDVAEAPKSIGVRLRDLDRRDRGAPAAVTTATAMLLVDPHTPAWLASARSAREEHPQVGLVVLVGRPSYLGQRLWMQRPWPSRPGVPFANGLVSVDSLTGDVIEALRRAAAQPDRETGFRLDGEATHPFGLARVDEDGREALRIRNNQADRHRLLVLTANGSTAERTAGLLGIRREEVAEKLRTLRRELTCANDVQLGWKATRLGLLDDAVDILAAELPDP